MPLNHMNQNGNTFLSIFRTISFYPSKVKTCIEKVLNEKLNDVKYDSETAGELCETLISSLRDACKRKLFLDNK